MSFAAGPKIARSGLFDYLCYCVGVLGCEKVCEFVASNVLADVCPSVTADGRFMSPPKTAAGQAPPMVAAYAAGGAAVPPAGNVSGKHAWPCSVPAATITFFAILDWCQRPPPPPLS